MSYSFLIPVISATSGDNEDGSLIGGVLESDFAGVFTDVRIAALVSAYRKDVSGSSFTFEDISTPLNNDTTSDALPFGTNAQMGVGDKFYISCEHRIKAMYFRVATAGVNTGTSGLGGSSIGGNAGTGGSPGGDGAAKTGSGGGGSESTANAGSGGSGIIVVRFATQSRSYQALTSYADNAAALAAGKLTGQFYKKTSDGSVQQVV